MCFLFFLMFWYNIIFKFNPIASAVYYLTPFQYKRIEFGFIKPNFAAQLLPSGGQNDERIYYERNAF